MMNHQLRAAAAVAAVCAFWENLVLVTAKSLYSPQGQEFCKDVQRRLWQVVNHMRQACSVLLFLLRTAILCLRRYCQRHFSSRYPRRVTFSEHSDGTVKHTRYVYDNQKRALGTQIRKSTTPQRRATAANESTLHDRRQTPAKLVFHKISPRKYKSSHEKRQVIASKKQPPPIAGSQVAATRPQQSLRERAKQVVAFDPSVPSSKTGATKRVSFRKVSPVAATDSAAKDVTSGVLPVAPEVPAPPLGNVPKKLFSFGSPTTNSHAALSTEDMKTLQRSFRAASPRAASSSFSPRRMPLGRLLSPRSLRRRAAKQAAAPTSASGMESENQAANLQTTNANGDVVAERAKLSPISKRHLDRDPALPKGKPKTLASTSSWMHRPRPFGSAQRRDDLQVDTSSKRLLSPFQQRRSPHVVSAQRGEDSRRGHFFRP